MNWSRPLISVVGALTLAGGLGGCVPYSVGSWEVTNGSTSQREDGATYSYSALSLGRNGQVYVLLATARGAGNSYRGGEGKCQGELHGKDGVKIGWSCATKDGQSGKVVVDNQEFDLTEGALFIVATSGKSLQLQQLVIDSAQLQMCSDVKKLLGVMKAQPRDGRLSRDMQGWRVAAKPSGGPEPPTTRVLKSEVFGGGPAAAVVRRRGYTTT